MTVSLTTNGLVLPASISASSNVNTLDDYEEGTWSPAANGGWGTNPDASDSNYITIGKNVGISGYWVAQGGGSGQRAVNTNGLPFTVTQPSGCTVTTINMVGGTTNFFGRRFSEATDEVLWNTNGGVNCGWNVVGSYISDK